MTTSSMPLAELLEKHDEGDFLRAVAEAGLQLRMETDVEGVVGAGRHERCEGRTTWRNGYRDRARDTWARDAEPAGAETAARLVRPRLS